MRNVAKGVLSIAPIFVARTIGFFAIVELLWISAITDICTTDKYLQVELVNCSNARPLTDDELKELPTLKRALDIADKKVMNLMR